MPLFLVVVLPDGLELDVVQFDFLVVDREEVVTDLDLVGEVDIGFEVVTGGAIGSTRHLQPSMTFGRAKSDTGSAEWVLDAVVSYMSILGQSPHLQG